LTIIARVTITFSGVALFVISSVCVLYPYVLLLDGWQEQNKKRYDNPLILDCTTGRMPHLKRLMRTMHFWNNLHQLGMHKIKRLESQIIKKNWEQ
jgi:hypothetical protein